MLQILRMVSEMSVAKVYQIPGVQDELVHPGDEGKKSLRIAQVSTSK